MEDTGRPASPSDPRGGKVRPPRPLQRHLREETPPARPKTPILEHFCCARRTFSCSRTRTRPSRATNFAHRTHKHGEIETNNTTAHPQQGATETSITSAPNNCTKNTHFPPAKATAVSIPHRHKQAKATMVSDHRVTSPTGPGCGTRGRRLGLAGLRADTPSHT